MEPAKTGTQKKTARYQMTRTMNPNCPKLPMNAGIKCRQSQRPNIHAMNPQKCTVAGTHSRVWGVYLAAIAGAIMNEFSIPIGMANTKTKNP